MIKKKGSVIRLDTENTTLVIKADTAEYLYFGRRLCSAADFGIFEGNPSRNMLSFPHNPDYTEPNLILCNADGGATYDFTFSRARILTEKPELADLPSSYGESKTVELKYVDLPTKVSLYLSYTVFEDCDVIAVSARLVNGAKKEIRVKRLMSLQMDLPGIDYGIVTFEGAWARERHKTERRIQGGVFCNESVRGSSSHQNNPFVMAKGDKGVYAFNLVYSGNHKEIFACDTEGGKFRVLVGMNDYMFDWPLAPGQELQTPEAVMCFAPDEDSMSRQMHTFVSEHIVRGKWKKRERPILFNNWEGTYFDFNEEKLLSIASAAKSLGAEMFVLDDGWFGKRDTDTCSLGDWYDNVEKTGGGLGQLADKIRALGLSFGIWVEPEMISEDSDLFRAHPNFAMKIPGRTPTRMRHQLMLNLADERVQNYVVRTISDVISRSGAEYVKWDYNRSMTDCYGKGVPAGEYFHRYMLGYYRVVSRIVKKFPSVLFEGCAGGGGRLDLGNLCYFQQYWTSDCTDARERIDIQEGTSYGYPQTIMSAHVSASPNHQTMNSSPIFARFNVACGGVLGYELDASVLSKEDSEAIAKQIAFYKENRKLLQFGDQYRLHGERSAGFITVAKDKNSAIAVVNLLERRCAMADPYIRLKGLNPAALYEVSVDGKQFTASGDMLMYGEIPLAGIFNYDVTRENSGCIQSRMYVIKRVKQG